MLEVSSSNGRVSTPGHGAPWVREQLMAASAALEAEGMPAVEAGGQLLRPMLALAGMRPSGPPPAGFWDAVLAVQLAHEASLVHDDIVDAASERRGAPTAVAAEGVPRALLRGDHLLTAAYRAAARTGSLAFTTLFARAVERTVSGEGVQGRAAGRTLDWAGYREIALGKSGELIGCALAAAPVLEGREDAAAVFELGRRVGLVYQMLDDLLDYCPLTGTGKPPLGDYAQRRWTWLLEEVPGLAFDRDPLEVLARLHVPLPGGGPARRALERLEREAAAVGADGVGLLPDHPVLRAMLDDWVGRAREAVAREAGARAAPLRGRVPPPSGVDRHLAEHSRSFRFAARFFPSADAARVARVYAYCRVTDDLVDRPPAEGTAAESLAVWRELSRRAYAGECTGHPLLDRVMSEMAGAGIPFRYADDLADGMRMDLEGVRYDSLAELREYTYRVASVVGLWLARLFGVRDPALLLRAEQLGHAMQLTNILRDVGEDWGRGRLYLPADLLARHQVTRDDLARMCAGDPPTAGYRRLVEELMGVAEEDYVAAMSALPALPRGFGRPVAVAAHVYRGIHAEIRRNGFDNLTRRAHTGACTKGVLAARGLWALHRASRGRTAARSPALPLAGGRGA